MKRNSLAGVVFDAGNYAGLALLAALMIVPFWSVLVSSVTAPHLVMEGAIRMWPKEMTLVAFKTIFNTPNFVKVFQNTVIITVLGTFISMLLSVMLAYPISKKRLAGANLMAFAVFFTMMFNGGIIPSYLLVKSLGMMNSLWSLMIPNAINAFNMMILISFFRTLPEELEDSGRMDGSNDFGILFRIMVPISMPILATLTLFYAVAQWNMFFQAVMYISNPDRFTLQVLLRQLLIVLTSDAVASSLSEDVPRIGVTVKLAMIVVSTVPILLVYPFLQKHFAKGMMLGSVKG
ncbi:carbohydrate ABC transporter permease [Paenibacillus doosanensis]|uniref:Inner membrane ABC transporter permease protein YcjP n=1 Tax=Paenibacillus konkukensis TaxID=2020716 RepID=A0ABY4RJV6_9BACL|nr:MULTISPECIES: carbohydrate ABC transporter permease [Paenibacillus]MCS7462894.1 carbohydrate ABC transporter permease [Paenibacillus doosanensis]UQZ82413.1 Inner membrane ABC transporter permease protein YcjP [Paenibacillus konkukensis]